MGGCDAEPVEGGGGGEDESGGTWKGEEEGREGRDGAHGKGHGVRLHFVVLVLVVRTDVTSHLARLIGWLDIRAIG